MQAEKIFRSILVPLDGSRLAESALTTAVWLARKMDARLTLVHVIEKNAPREVHSERHLVTSREASAYLEEVSRLPALAGLRVSTHVHEVEVSDVARSIAEHSAELAPDLIVICTHGNGGLRRLLFGVIAQQVVSLATVPVLIVHPSKEARGVVASGDFRTILAPIDGDPSHEKGLPVAAELARAFDCRLHLLDGGAGIAGSERAQGGGFVHPAGSHAGRSGNGERRRSDLPRRASRGTGRPGNKRGFR